MVKMRGGEHNPRGAFWDHRQEIWPSRPAIAPGPLRGIAFRRRYATGDLFLGFYAPSHPVGEATETAHTLAAVSPLRVMRAFRSRQSSAAIS
jgi:hypothetical protein